MTIDAKHARAYRLADNRSGELSSWNFDVLKVELAALPTLADDIPALSFDAIVPPALDIESLDSDVPAIPEPTSMLGDVWKLGRHRLACGDSPNDFDSTFPVCEEGLVLTDPPYGINIVKSGKVGHGGAFGPAFRKGTVGGARLHEKWRGGVQPRRYNQIANDDKPFDPSGCWV